MYEEDSSESAGPADVMTAFMALSKSRKKSTLTRCENLAIPCSAAGRSGVGYGFFRIWK